MSSKGYAFFDLDHTLLPHDTQGLFCNFMLRRERWRVLYLLVFAPSVILYVVRAIDLRTLKRVFCSYLWRMPEVRLRGYAREFAHGTVKAVLYGEVVAELRGHQEAGRVSVLNTASPAFYGEAIADMLGFDHCLATRVRVDERMPLVPVIEGENNKREAKVAAMRQAFEDVAKACERGEKISGSAGYSDSGADVPMLMLCEEVTLVHPNAELRAAADANKWERVLRPDRPYAGRWGDRLASARQALGLYRPPAEGSAGASKAEGD